MRIRASLRLRILLKSSCKQVHVYVLVSAVGLLGARISNWTASPGVWHRVVFLGLRIWTSAFIVSWWSSLSARMPLSFPERLILCRGGKICRMFAELVSVEVGFCVSAQKHNLLLARELRSPWVKPRGNCTCGVENCRKLSGWSCQWSYACLKD